MTAVKVNKRTFCLWYHSARSPVTCQCNKRDMYEPKGKISPFMAKQHTSAARRCPVRPVGAYFLDNDRRSIHYPLHIPLLGEHQIALAFILRSNTALSMQFVAYLTLVYRLCRT